VKARFTVCPTKPGGAYRGHFSDLLHEMLSRSGYNPKGFPGWIMKFQIVVAICSLTSFLAAGGYSVMPDTVRYTFAAHPTQPMIIDNGKIVQRGTACNIKGNISINSGEHIFHVPGQHYYAATKISPQYGERWFCSEQEASAAGWRKAKF
jgi:hypothetical protein